MPPVDRVPEVFVASGRVPLGGSPGGLVVPPSPGGAPIIDSFPGVSSPARTSLGAPVRSGWFSIVSGTIWPRSRWLGTSLLSQQYLDLLLGLALALKELDRKSTRLNSSH